MQTLESRTDADKIASHLEDEANLIPIRVQHEEGMIESNYGWAIDQVGRMTYEGAFREGVRRFRELLQRHPVNEVLDGVDKYLEKTKPPVETL